ncbi:MAG: ATP synthase F1 subunit delta [Dehalococcoidia bacterium]
MAGQELAAKRYARAAFAIALAGDGLEGWAADLGLMAAVMGDPQGAAVLESVRLPQPAKYRLLEQALAGIDPLAMNLAKLLVARGRSGLAGQILEEYRALVDEHRGLAHAVVTTAVPLGDAEREAIAQRLGQLTGRQVTVATRVNPGIIGGLVARIGDTLIDGSVRTRLLALRRSLAGRGG